MEAQTVFARTPIFQSPLVNAARGQEVYFKMDCYQPTRSFKLRGMAHLVDQCAQMGHRHFVASSGGNAGYSLAYAARRAGASVHVVTPTPTPRRIQELILGEGATLTLHGQTWDEAHEYALNYAQDTEARYVSPFDDPLLWEGHATIIDECAAEIPEPDVVVAAVGGGGLLCGIMEGMERNRWTRAVFLSAETEGAASYATAVKAGKVVTLDRMETVATSLGAKQVAEEAFRWSQRRPVYTHLCTDAQAIQAVTKMADQFQVIVEPACGAALSTVFVPNTAISQARSILVIVCGGVLLDSASLFLLQQRFGILHGGLAAH